MAKLYQSPLPWQDERLHKDDAHPRLCKERGAAGQHRLALQYAAALSRSPLEAAQVIANRLRSCSPNNRCGSGADPVCTWATGRWFRQGAAALSFGADQMIFSTVQLPDSRSLVETLEEVDADQQKNMLTRVIRKAGLNNTPIFGGMDLSLNHWPESATERWSAHWALYSIDRDPQAFTKTILGILPTSPLVEKPVVTKFITRTPDTVFSYGFKNRFERKTLPRSESEQRVYIGLQDPEFTTLAINLNRIGIMERFFFQNCSFT